MTELTFDYLVQGVGVGFAIAMIGWFAAWGVSKLYHLFVAFLR